MNRFPISAPLLDGTGRRFIRIQCLLLVVLLSLTLGRAHAAVAPEAVRAPRAIDLATDLRGPTQAPFEFTRQFFLDVANDGDQDANGVTTTVTVANATLVSVNAAEADSVAVDGDTFTLFWADPFIATLTIPASPCASRSRARPPSPPPPLPTVTPTRATTPTNTSDGFYELEINAPGQLIEGALFQA